MRRILFDSPPAGKSFLASSFATFVAISFTLGCQSKVQNTSVDAGGGMRKGSPPMCYQYRGEARKTYDAYDIFVHVNNTCSYPVACLIYDDVNEKESQLSMPAYQAQSLALALNVQASRVNLKVECTWKP
jgi:hypothetical protein